MLGYRYIFSSGKILAGYRVFVLKYLLRRSCKDHLAAVFAGAWAYINYVIGVKHGLLVMLDNYKRVAKVAHAL